MSLLYIGTVFPFRLCFMEFHIPTPSEDQGTLLLIEEVIDVIFWLDLVSNFFFSFTDQNGREVRNLRRIVEHYLKGFFFINLVACIPPELFGLILSPFTDTRADEFNKGLRIGRIQQITRLIALTRLVRLVKLASFLAESSAWKKMKETRSLVILNFIGCLFWVVHLLACGWYLCAALHTDPTKTWVARRNIPFDESTTLLNATPGEQWLHSMYFVLTVFTTVGFGDIHAVTTWEIVYVCITMVIGAIVHSIVVGEMISLVMKKDEESIDRAHQKELIDGFARHTELDDRTMKTLRLWAGSGKPSRFGYDQEQMRSLLTSSQIPRDIMMKLPEAVFGGEVLRNRFVISCRCSQQLPPRFPALVALMLNRRQYSSGESVYQSHDQAWNLFLVASGTFANVGKPGVMGGTCPSIGSADANDDFVLAYSCTTPSLPRIESAPNPTLLTRVRTRMFSKADETQSHKKRHRGFYAYQLFGKRSYFGDSELFENVPRRSSVRCESSQGSLLCLHKKDLKRLMEDFPAFKQAWSAIAKRREVRRVERLRRLTMGQNYKNLAASTIQDFWRSRKTFQVNHNDSSSRLSLDSFRCPPINEPGVECQGGFDMQSRDRLRSCSKPSMQSNEVVALRSDVDALRSEMRASFKQLQLCIQSAVDGTTSTAAYAC